VKAGAIVCDTGPILHLQEAGVLDLLPRFGAVQIPPAVEAEAVRWLPGWPAGKPAWIRTVLLEGPPASQAAAWISAGLLHRGEAEALALALQLNAGLFLTDDTSARVLAKTLGVETHGSLGIVLKAVVLGCLNRTDSLLALEALFASSLWVSPAVRKQAREALAKIHAQS